MDDSIFGLIILSIFFAPIVLFVFSRIIIAIKDVTPKTQELQSDLKRRITEYEKKENEIAQQKLNAEEQISQDRIHFEEEIKNKTEEYKKAIHELSQKGSAEYPQLASAIADLETLHYAKSADYLKTKPNPAYTAAETVRNLREETKKIIAEKKQLEYEICELKFSLPKNEYKSDLRFSESDSHLSEMTILHLREENQRIISEKKQLESQIRALENDLSQKKRESEMTIHKVLEEAQKIAEDKKQLEHQVYELKTDLSSNEHKIELFFSETYSQLSEMFGNDALKSMYDQIPSDTFLRAVSFKGSFESPATLTCLLRSPDSGKVYTTSLTSCSCESFKYGHSPCKHMIWLSYRMGLLFFNKEQGNQIMEKIISETKISQNYLLQAKKQKRILEEKSKFIQENELTYPWLANLLALYDDEVDKYRKKILEDKAKKSAEIVSQIRAEKRMILAERNILRNQLLVYESLFPWLEEFKEVSVKDAATYVLQTSDNKDYSASLKKWLSPEEYTTLSDREKTELALNRYQKRKKTDWEIGIEYERYIGYIYEKNGYTVKYTGATMGLSDMGRDLIAEKDNKTLVIQCKRWASEKSIHEKHIFQLFGTSYIMRLSDPKREYTPVFYTTATLSKTASLCASGLGISVYEKYQFDDYPVIKCNIGHDVNGYSVKIYHLPFDQQYDRIVIDPSKGEFYASTIQEAEDAGFRHAYKWTGS